MDVNQGVTFDTGGTADNNRFVMGDGSLVELSSPSTNVYQCDGSSASLDGASSVSCAGSVLNVFGAGTSGTVDEGSTVDVNSIAGTLAMDNGSTVNIAAGDSATLSCGGLTETVTSGPDSSSGNYCSLEGSLSQFTTDLNGGTVDLGDNGAGSASSFTEDGSGNTYDVGANVNLTSSGSDNTITLNNNDNLNDAGATEVNVTIDPNCTDGIHCDGNDVTLDGGDTLTDEGDQINVGGGQTDTLNGYGDSVRAGVSDNLTLDQGSIGGTMYGLGDNINLGNDDTLTNDTQANNGNLFDVNVNLESSATDTLTGSTACDVNLSTGDTLTGYNDADFFDGGSDVLDGSGDHIYEEASGTLTGSGDYFSNILDGTDYNGLQDVVSGSGDQFTQASSDVLFLTGSGDSVTGLAGDTLELRADSSADVTNTYETIGLDGNDASADGNGDTFSVFGTGDTVTGGYDGITLSGTQTAFVDGGGDRISEFLDDSVVLQGGNDTVSGASGDNLIFIGNDDSATVTNSGEDISFWSGNDTADASNDTFSWNTLGGPESNTNEFVTGNNDTFNDTGTGDNLVLTGTSDILNGQSGDGLILLNGDDSATVTNAGESISFWSGSDTVNGSNDSYNWNTLGGPLTDASETVNGSSDSLTLGASDHLYLDGGSDTFNETTGDAATIVGSISQLPTDSGTGVAGDQATFDNLSSSDSQLQILDPNSSSLLEYSDYSGLNDTGKLDDQSFDFTNGTSQTTWFDPTGYADISQATEKFTGEDDTGDLSSLNVNSTQGYTFNDSFNYSGNTLEDFYQEITDTSSGKELADDEFNGQGKLIDAIYGYAPAYTPDLGYSYSYAVGTGQRSFKPGQFGLHYAMGRTITPGTHHTFGGITSTGVGPIGAAAASLPELAQAMAVFGAAGAHVNSALPPPYAMQYAADLAATHHF